MAKFKRGDVVQFIHNAANKKECEPESLRKMFLVTIPFMRIKGDYGRVFVCDKEGVDFAYPAEALELAPRPETSYWGGRKGDRKMLADRQLKETVEWCLKHNLNPPTKEKRFYAQ